MLVLLPPSEGKSSPARGRPLDLGRLSFPELTGTRRRVSEQVQRLCSRSPANARAALGLSMRQDEERVRNAELFTSPCAPAWQVYTGVLYDALDFPSLPAPARRRAATSLVVSSALFGLLRITDEIPAYRLSADSVVPGVGRLAALWKTCQPDALAGAAGRGIVLDLRSTSYAALGPVPPELLERTVVARVLHGGKVVSHHNKATKGRLVRALLELPAPRTIPDLAGALGAVTSWDGSSARVRLSAPTSDRTPWTMDVEVSHL